MPPKNYGRNSTDIIIKGIGASKQTVNDLHNELGSAGIYEGCIISDSGSGQIDISAGKGAVRSSNSDSAQLFTFSIVAATDISLTDNSMNYVYIDYNAGNPIFAVTTDYDSINFNTQIVIGRVYRSGTILNISNVGQRIRNHTVKDLYRIQTLRRLDHSSGAVLSFTAATLKPNISAGVFFSNYDKITTAAWDSNTGGTFTYWYRNGSGGWTQVTSQTSIDNQNYDNNTGTLTALAAGDYGVHWVYILSDGSVHIQYGQASYTSAANARNSTIPASQPPAITGMGILVGRIIVLKNATTILETSSAFAITFTGIATTNHNDLASIQGGISAQYYHLSSADYTVRNLPVVEVTGTTQQAVIRTRYIANNAGLVTITLPTSAVVGDFVEVEGYGAGGWKIAQNAGQLIRFLSAVSTTGTGGSIASTTRYDSVHLRCVVANTTWVVVNAVGQLTVT